ncbi:MAG: hypothetical protein MJE77_18355 [Proteobacteria bacterium]|nr:hypothetical protein [Pseudomonadota bacterium]
MAGREDEFDLKKLIKPIADSDCIPAVEREYYVLENPDEAERKHEECCAALGEQGSCKQQKNDSEE